MLKYAPTGLAKLAAQLEHIDKTASPLPRGVNIGRAAGYGSLAGLGLYGGQKLLSAAGAGPDPAESGDSAISSASRTAVGGAAIAGLLNLLNKITARRR